MFRAGRVLALLAVVGFSAATARAQDQDFSKVEIKTEKVAEGLYALFGAGGNIGVSVGADGVFMIDDQYAPLSDKLLAAIKALSDKPLRFLVNTHWHGDHTGGNENFSKTGVVIVGHDNVRKRMSTNQFIAAFKMKVDPSPPVALPIITFSDTATFHFNGQEIDAFHVPPAHTDGDSALYFPGLNVLHTGDLFFNGLYPFIDVDSNGSIDGMIGAADKILPMINDQTKIIPGHGPVGTKADYAAFRDMLKTARDSVNALIQAGKSEEEAVAAKPMASLEEKWGKGFLNSDLFTQIVYKSLKANSGSDKGP
jgi:glyoxylase-like metal-dependent hydrolase (beta-lactamase superfamily II)